MTSQKNKGFLNKGRYFLTITIETIETIEFGY